MTVLCSSGLRELGRRSTTTRGEGPTGWLPGLAAAEKEQAASHDPAIIAGSPAAMSIDSRGQPRLTRHALRIAGPPRDKGELSVPIRAGSDRFHRDLPE